MNPSYVSVPVKLFLVAALLFLATFTANASEKTVSVERLIAGHKWHQASRSVLLEAHAIDSKEWSVAGNQAKAGFVDDALFTAASMFPTSRTALLIDIANSAPRLTEEKKSEILQLALNNARHDIGQNYLRSGALIEISLAYLAAGDDALARTLFDESVLAATKGLNESGGGYRRITEELAKSELRQFNGFAFDSLVLQIAKSPDYLDAAFAYLDMAKFYAALSDRKKSKQLLQLAIESSKTWWGKTNLPKKAAVDAITRFAFESGEIDFAEKYGDRGQLLPNHAILAASQGKHTEAIALVQKLSVGMYVDYQSSTMARIFSDAIRRRDLDAAVFYAERTLKGNTVTKISQWRQIAELQNTFGAKPAAKTSYERAASAFKEKLEHEYFDSEIKATLELGGSMIRSGFNAEGRTVIASTTSQLRTIPDRRLEDRIKTQISVALALCCIGKAAECTEMLLAAYRATNSDSKVKLRSQSERASVLSAIGLALAQLDLKDERLL